MGVHGFYLNSIILMFWSDICMYILLCINYYTDSNSKISLLIFTKVDE